MCPFSPQTLFCLEFTFIVIQSHFFTWKKQLLRQRTFNNCWARAQMRRANSKWSPLVSKLRFIIYITWYLFLRFSYHLTAFNLYCSKKSSCNPSPNWHTGTKLKLKTFRRSALFFFIFIMTALEQHILLLSPAKLTIYNAIHMSSYTTTSRSVN